PRRQQCSRSAGTSYRGSSPMFLRHRVARRGAAAVEAAAVIPFLLYLCVIGADWARLMYYTITIEHCARNGAMYASDSIYASQSPYATLTDAALADAPNLSPAPDVSSSNTTDGAGNAAVKVTVSMTFNTITSFPGVPTSESL